MSIDKPGVVGSSTLPQSPDVVAAVRSPQSPELVITVRSPQSSTAPVLDWFSKIIPVTQPAKYPEGSA